MCRHLFLLLALGLEACTSESPRSLSEEDRAAIRAAHEERAQAMMKGDAKAAAGVATADGVILPPGLPMREGRGHWRSGSARGEWHCSSFSRL